MSLIRISIQSVSLRFMRDAVMVIRVHRASAAMLRLLPTSSR
ncbi:MAG: hypothetical protein U0794_11745 [Isosphaeraceae bacterium]